MRRILCALTLLCVLAFAALASSFNRACSVTGGSAQQLSAVLATCGYAGTNQLQELTIINPATATLTLYVGQSDVSAANGVALLPGDAITFNSASQQDVIAATSIYLFVSSTQTEAFALRHK